MKNSQVAESSDVFPVFDPVTEEFQGHKPRVRVHREGDWHRGVQANVVRPNAIGTFDILVQERSSGVDIAGGKFDQSLATQMLDEDGRDQDTALRRGLRDELGITDYRSVRLPRRLRIVKTYDEHPDTLNRELISLYLVTAENNDEIVPASPKVRRAFWMEWAEFLTFFAKNRTAFTKTGQFYFGTPLLVHEATALTHQLLAEEIGNVPEDVVVGVNRVGRPPRTYYGQVDVCLREAGEAA